MLEDYLHGIEYLTVNQNIVLINRSIKQQGEYMQQSLKEMGEKHKKEIELLDEKYRDHLNKVNQDMVKAIKNQEETTEKLNSLDDIFRLVFDGALNNQKEAREVHSKNKTLEKNFANAVLSINEFINNNPEFQHAFKALLDKRELNLPSSDEIIKSLKEQEEQESGKDEKKVIDYYNGKFYGI